MKAVKVLSCIPKQLNDTDAKLDWLVDTIKEHSPGLFVTPQEFFGGVVMMPQKKAFTYKELGPKIEKIAKGNKCAIALGVVELCEDGLNRERIWFINEKGEYQGQVTKFALPRYDHVSTSGYGDIVPELEYENRFKVFEMNGLMVSSIFCWEAFAGNLWAGLAQLQPDLVLNQIKFGINGWPSIEKKKGLATVKGFGNASWPQGQHEWEYALRAGSTFQVRCPVICSTNSWNLKPITVPLCGCISEIDGQLPEGATESLWQPTKDMKLKEIPEKIIIDEIHPGRVRGARENKFKYKEMVGEFPPFSLGRWTMHMKIGRIESRLMNGKEQKHVDRALEKQSKGGPSLGL